ncbi:SWIM zinc finger family protein [bacterium]|nr:SWIM zinc finger family protein [bacterium]
MDEMSEITESGFRVTVPKETSFRFCDCPAYQRLSGLCLKEMDIGWWDKGTSRLLLIELKGEEVWREFDKSKVAAHEHMLTALKGKLTDTLLMLVAVWIETGVGKELSKSLPALVRQYPGDGKLGFVFLVDTPASRSPMLTAVKDDMNKELEGRMRLFGVRRVAIVNLAVAQDIGIPVERQA